MILNQASARASIIEDRQFSHQASARASRIRNLSRLVLGLPEEGMDSDTSTG